MNIAFISALYPPNTKGGGEISTHLLAQGLVGLGHKVTVFTEGNGREETDYEGVKVVRLPIKLTAKPLFEHWHTKRQVVGIRGEVKDFDVVHAHDWRSALILAELDLDQSVVTVRDYAQISGDTNFILRDGDLARGIWSDAWLSQRIAESSWPRKLFRWWQYAFNIRYRRKSFQRLKYQVYISEAERKLIGRYQDLKEIESIVIHNPVQPEHLRGGRESGTAGAVLYVGRIEMYKGVDLLLEAWRIVMTKNPQAKLRIVGDGAQREEYEQYVNRHGLRYSVSFDGHMPWNRLRAVYDEAKILVAPHRWVEPFGRTIIEAMARGKIVLAANIGGPTEVIISGETGFFFEHGSSSDLSEQLIKLLDLNAASETEIGKAAIRWVEQNLTVEKIAARYESFYLANVVT